MKPTKFSALIGIILSAVFALAGCGAAGSLLETANGGIGGLFITQAVVRYIDGAGDQAADFARAERVKAVTSELRAAASGEAVTVATLRAIATSKIPPDLAIADRLLALELINIAATTLEERYGSGPIVDVDLPNLDSLLRRIEFAASYFAAPA